MIGLNAVVFDLELMKRFKKGQLSQIVEIGACKIDQQTNQLSDQFHLYIKPNSGHFTKSTKRFIKMTEDDVKSAVSFREGIQQFTEWLGTDYFLCSWGIDDKAHFINQCVRMKMDVGWVKNYNNIQPQISKLIDPDTPHPLGLTNALQLAGIEHIGKAHRGIDDAVNTATLFMKYANDITLQTNEVTKKELASYYKKWKKAKYEQKQLRQQNSRQVQDSATRT